MITDAVYQQEILGLDQLLNHYLTTGEMPKGVSSTEPEAEKETRIMGGCCLVVLLLMNRLSRSVDATAQRGAPEVATGSDIAWADLGCGQSFQQVFHPPQAADITNDSEQLVAAVKAANYCDQLGYCSNLGNGNGISDPCRLVY